MAFAGFKKQLNKVNQFVAEKVGGADSTPMDPDFIRMEEKFNVTCELVEDLQGRTIEFLQPNPGARAIVSTVKGLSSITGQTMDSTYPQPEAALAECMVRHGSRLGDDSNLGLSLVQTGEAMKKLSVVKYSLDAAVKKDFLEPLHQMETKELKEVVHLKKKLESRRLDYDGKRRRNSREQSAYRLNEEEVRVSEEKFVESLQLAQLGMHNILIGETEQISHLMAFADALLEYHQQCTGILEEQVANLKARRDEAERRPKPVFIPKKLAGMKLQMYPDEPPPPYSPSGDPPPYSPNSSGSTRAPPLPSPTTRTASKRPYCTALYDFDPEKPEDLGIKTGDKIMLIKHVDEFWYQGNCNGRSGYFPKNFVKVEVPLPSK